MKETIDLNDLRMNMPQETIEIIGITYPQAEDRARRLRAILRAIYLREHEVQLHSLADSGKTETKEYIQTLEGMTHFVAGRVLALYFGVSAFPIDDRTFQALMNAGVLHEDTDLDEASSWLGRQVKAKDVSKVHGSLHSWAEKQPTQKKPAKSSSKKPAAKTTTKKVSKKKVSKKKTTRKTSKK